MPRYYAPGYYASGYFAEATFWEDNLLRFLPAEYQTQDAIGDLQDFMQVVAVSMDEMQELTDKWVEIFDVERCDPKYLPLIARTVRFPLDERDSVADQRRQLLNAVLWYKRKGLAESFRILFYSLGYSANLIELWTSDYETFHRYPASWVPPKFRATVYGTTDTALDISPGNRSLLLSFDGSQPTSISLPLGEDQPLADIAAEVHSGISGLGEATVIGGQFVLRSNKSGESSFVQVINTENSAYEVLGISPGTAQGVDERVPDDLPDLQENGGSWYKSPHFGIEVFSIRDFSIGASLGDEGEVDPEEIAYLKERIQLVRPVHTVLEFLLYLKSISEVFGVSEEHLIGEIGSRIAEMWPFPICMSRNAQIVFIRDGVVTDRSESLRVSYRHFRDGVDTAHRRGEFDYQFPQAIRSDPDGPVQMPGRGTPRYFRGGIPIGIPLRIGCGEDSESLLWELTYGPEEDWCAGMTRGNGFVLRDQPSTYFRDGTFSRIYSRNNGNFHRWSGPIDLSETLDEYSTIMGQDAGEFDDVLGELEGHIYVKAELPGGYYRITKKTVLEFDFQGSSQGNIHAIGFYRSGGGPGDLMEFSDGEEMEFSDGEEMAFSLEKLFAYQLWGTEAGSISGTAIGRVNQDHDNYPSAGIRHYRIWVGAKFSGEWATHLVLIQDDDSSGSATCQFFNIEVREVGLDPDPVFDRSGCNPVFGDLDLKFQRPDLPGVWFESLETMNDPNVLGLPTFPGPE